MSEKTISLNQRSDDLVSTEIRELVSCRPHWMVRHGNLMFFAVLSLLSLLAFAIQYPDLVNASARIVAVNAPKLAVAHKAGKVMAIYTSTGTSVIKGQHLALIESTADYAEVVQLQQWIQITLQRAQSDLKSLASASVPSFANLGELQNVYESFFHEWTEWQQLFGDGYYQKKKASLLGDIWFTNQLKKNINKQQTLSLEERNLQKEELAVYDSLAKDRVIAPMDMTKYKTNLLQKDQSLSQTDEQKINTDIAVHAKHKELLDLEKIVADQREKFISAVLVLKAEIEKWMQENVITAPETGTVFFLLPLQTGEQVSNGQELFYVQSKTTSYYAQLMAGQNGLGKLKEGQRVRLKVESYPSEQFGYVKGVVSSIAAFPSRRDSFLIQVRLPNGLITVYKKELFFRNNMLAQAEIVTAERTLFERFSDPIRRLWQH